MSASMRICTVLARGGSKGLPGKNSKLLGGIPLLAHSIRQAFGSGMFEDVVFSSDSDELLEIAKREGASTVKRPNHLAYDESGKLPGIIHAVCHMEQLNSVEYETVIDLDVTSPLRSVQDIKNVIAILENQDLDSVFSASRSRKSPYFNIAARVEGRWGPAAIINPYPRRRQDAPETFDMNGSVYAWNKHSLMEHQAVFLEKTDVYVMQDEASWDIDTQLDFDIVSYLFARKELLGAG